MTNKKNTEQHKNSKNTKHSSIKFKKKQIQYPEENPVDELMSLYEDEIAPEEKEQEQFSLKEIIEQKRRSHRTKMIFLFLFILVLLAAASLAGFFYFNEYKPSANENLRLEIEGPETITTNETFEYKIAYDNIGEVDLNNCKLTVQYPHGFILESSAPESGNHRWELGNLYTYDKGEIVIKGKIIDDTDIEQKLVVNFNFQPSNFHSDFTKSAHFSTVLEKPEMEIISSQLANVSLGQKFEIKAKIDNKSEIAFENIRISFVFPESFEIENQSPETDEENTWVFEDLLERNQSPEILVSGAFKNDLTFSNQESREQNFAITVSIPDADEQYHVIEEKEFTIKIIDQAIATYLIINGSSENKNIELENNLTFSLILKNNGDQTFENISTRAVIDCDPLDILDWEQISEEVQSRLENTDIGKTLTWTGSQIDKLKKFGPGDEEIITFSVPLKSYNDLADESSYSLGQTEITALAQVILSSEADSAVPTIESSPIKLKINSDLYLDSKALYHYEDGNPIGEGPWPPKAGEKTKLNVFWELNNHLHDLEKITVSAKLPENINWAGSKNTSVGEIEYNAIENEVVWTINWLPQSVNTAKSNFAINIEPDQSQIGEIVELLGITTVSAKDKFTDDIIIKTAKNINSTLENDDFVTSAGKVE